MHGHDHEWPVALRRVVACPSLTWLEAAQRRRKSHSFRRHLYINFRTQQVYAVDTTRAKNQRALLCDHRPHPKSHFLQVSCIVSYGHAPKARVTAS